MSAPAKQLVQSWGDRTALLPKSMLYVLSLCARVQIGGRYLTVLAGKGALYHVFDDRVVTMPEGLRCDLPTGDLVGGTGELGSADDPASQALKLRLQLALKPNERLLMECLGVINMEGGMSALRSLPAAELAGSAFVATRHETDSSTFRWFNRRQLFGVGRAQGAPGSRPRELDLSFDLYASAS